MDRRRSILLAVAAVAVAIVAVLASQGGGGSAPAGQAFPTVRETPRDPIPAQCLPLPERIPMPAWVPRDLPLPEGTYAAFEPESGAGVTRVVLAAKSSLREFVRMVLEEWPEAGWGVGRGESEPGEAESNFNKGDRYGVFRARSVYCEQGWIELVLVMTSAPAASPSP